MVQEVQRASLSFQELESDGKCVQSVMVVHGFVAVVEDFHSFVLTAVSESENRTVLHLSHRRHFLSHIPAIV